MPKKELGNNKISVKCKNCSHSNIFDLKQLALMSKININNDTDILGIHLPFRCSKCSSRNASLSVISKAIKEKQNILIKCPYDGMTYEKGKLCPNYANHGKITSHRKKRKANDMYTIHRGE